MIRYDPCPEPRDILSAAVCAVRELFGTAECACVCGAQLHPDTALVVVHEGVRVFCSPACVAAFRFSGSPLRKAC